MVQVGVMGSAADLDYTSYVETLAYEIGKEIAKAGYKLVYGAEKDSDSLSSVACKGAKSLGGYTIGITYGKTDDIWGDMKQYTDVIICTGMERGGGREFVLVSSCDAIITIGGGSGTLNEITIAYQKKIPIVCMQNTGGWSDKLVNTYIDDRYMHDPYRYVCKGYETPTDAIQYLQSLLG